MRHPFLALAGIVFAVGCVEQHNASLPPVGPGPGTVLNEPLNTGHLVVYSAWRRTGTDDPDHRIHGNYEILTEDGQPFLSVRNYVTPMLEDPATVPLAPGKYLVKARVQRYGFVKIPVVIQSRKATVLYLDDSTRPEEIADATQVKLPDGRAIGWASAAAH